MKWGPAARFGALFFLASAVLGVSLAPAFWNSPKKAPDFSLSTPEGQTIRLSSLYQNQPVLLIFWASWCPTCVEEIPAVNALSEKYASRNLRVLGINVQESRGALREFLKTHPVKYSVLMDETGEASSRYKIQGIPVSVVLAKGGEILYYGFSLPGNLDELLDIRRT